MTILVRIFLVIILSIPAVPVRAGVSTFSKDCVICGHECCCPDACAAKLKEVQKSKRDSTCGTPKQGSNFLDSSCGRSDSLCRIQKAPPVGFLNLNSKELWRASPIFLIADRNRREPDSFCLLLVVEKWLWTFDGLELPTPPPRSHSS